MLWGWSEEFGWAYHQWLYNGKPSNIIRDQLPYLRVDAAQRERLVQQWNRPHWWPVLALPIVLLLMAWPAWKAWQRRQQARGLSREGASA